MRNIAKINWQSFTKSDLQTFFEHNMRFLFYSDALCIQIKRLRLKGRPKKRQFFRQFGQFQIKNLFSSQCSSQ